MLLIIFVGTALPKRINHEQKIIAQCTPDLIEIETKSKVGSNVIIRQTYNYVLLISVQHYIV